MPYTGLMHPEPLLPLLPLQQATSGPYLSRRYLNSVSIGSLSPGVDKILFEPSKHLWWVLDLILNMISPLLPSCWCFSLALGVGYHFGGSNILSIVAQQRVVILEFLQKKMSACPTTPPSYSQKQVKQEMARVNINILGISEVKWPWVDEFNPDDHYIHYCGKESKRNNGVSIIVNKRVWNTVLGWNLKTIEWSLFVFKANHSISY